ncbi:MULTISPECIES: hypothetical protein [unclassified Flavobacterium]|uniref:hypothetical protein n=1 Tax=unclassified Flavobacterium TaxID=196869 RepID=UPI001F12D23F|nr:MULTISPECIES: hypothetical protein [unclassified Flavobacterium]UMY65364.1 hypothetical protein MKO97_12755 [Flavobacterium sp. HJ-32-4]
MKYLVCFLFSTLFATAQTGINTSTPQATLDVVGSPAVSTSLDGIMVPRKTLTELNALTYTSAQTGAMVYVTTIISTTTSQTAAIKIPGYYCFDGTSWQPFNPTYIMSVVVGDIRPLSVITPLTVDGFAVSATLSSPSPKWNDVLVTHNLGLSASQFINVELQSNSTASNDFTQAGLDNNLWGPVVIHNVTANSFSVFLEEDAADSTQNLRLNIEITPY